MNSNDSDGQKAVSVACRSGRKAGSLHSVQRVWASPDQNTCSYSMWPLCDPTGSLPLFFSTMNNRLTCGLPQTYLYAIYAYYNLPTRHKIVIHSIKQPLDVFLLVWSSGSGHRVVTTTTWQRTKTWCPLRFMTCCRRKISVKRQYYFKRKKKRVKHSFYSTSSTIHLSSIIRRDTISAMFDDFGRHCR